MFDNLTDSMQAWRQQLNGSTDRLRQEVELWRAEQKRPTERPTDDGKKTEEWQRAVEQNVGQLRSDLGRLSDKVSFLESLSKSVRRLELAVESTGLGNARNYSDELTGNLKSLNDSLALLRDDFLSNRANASSSTSSSSMSPDLSRLTANVNKLLSDVLAPLQKLSAEHLQFHDRVTIQ
jgi:hypothetical protein